MPGVSTQCILLYMDEEKNKNAKFNRKKGDIEIEVVDPIYDVMSDDEIDEASSRFSSLLEDSEEVDTTKQQ